MFRKLFVKATPLPHFQKPQLEAFTLDFQFKPFSSNREPTFLSYGIFEDETDFREVIKLYLQQGRLDRKDESDVTVVLYENRNANPDAPIRITIAGNDDSFSVYFDAVKTVSKSGEWKSIPMGGSLVLGQHQEEFEGGFDRKDRVRGKICNFQMWDFKLSEGQLGLLFASDVTLKGNIFDSPPTYEFAYKNPGQLEMAGSDFPPDSLPDSPP